MSLLAAAKQALEALEQSDVEGRNKVLRNLRAAIETAKKEEPVYQVWERFEYPSHWRDTDEQEYNREKEDDRRILYTHPAPAPEGLQLVPCGNTDRAKEIIYTAFETAMLEQAGEIGPLTLRQRNAIFATVWSCMNALFAAAPKPEEK